MKKLKLWRVLFATLVSGLASSCYSQQEVQLLTDPGFARGFNLLGIRSIDTGGKALAVLNYNQPDSVHPAWRLCQWGTKHSLHNAELETLHPGVFRYSNTAKSVVTDTGKGEISLGAKASSEYARPRIGNQEWPHLLVEQYFSKKPLLKDLQQLRMQLDVRLSQFDDRMSSETRDPALHAAQLQIYLMVQNQQTSSSAFGDYLWFGLPLFDNRDAMPAEAFHQDGGKLDTTYKFIYLMPAKAFLKKGLDKGEWATIDVDTLPYIKRACALARAEGFLTGSVDDELAVTSINIGWELPGTFDVEATIKGLKLVAKSGAPGL